MFAAALGSDVTDAASLSRSDVGSALFDQATHTALSGPHGDIDHVAHLLVDEALLVLNALCGSQARCPLGSQSASNSTTSGQSNSARRATRAGLRAALDLSLEVAEPLSPQLCLQSILTSDDTFNVTPLLTVEPYDVQRQSLLRQWSNWSLCWTMRLASSLSTPKR